MKSSKPQICDQLEQLSQQFIRLHEKKYQCLPKVEYDENWISPCQQGEPSESFISWQPKKINESLSFNNVEHALDLKIHEDFKVYFSCIFSESIPADCSEGYLELLFAWNKDDFERLQQNLIGHILMKRKLKQAITLFFAVTDQDDMLLSVNNETGEVWVEKVGCEPHKKLASSIAEFIGKLSISL